MSGASWLTWGLGTLLPGIGVLGGALKWFVRQEMRVHVSKIESLTVAVEDLGQAQGKTEAKVDKMYDMLLRRLTR